MNHHATCISWHGIGILLTGPPASGKSELAWQLINMGAELIADDQVILSQQNDQWVATCPPEIRNKIHLRDMGMIDITAAETVIIKIIFQSTLPAFPLSQAPKINIPVVSLDFKAENAAQALIGYLRGLTA